MYMLISPAKSLDLETAVSVASATHPELLDQAVDLVHILRDLAPFELATLMKLSDKLAALNAQRYAEFSTPFTANNAKPAIYTFQGDVYQGLDASGLSKSDVRWLQKRLGILSGLYGLLRPLDLMQAYRLEMGTRLATPKGKDLYQFWGDRIGQLVEQRMKQSKTQQLVNLASNEYFKSVRAKSLSVELITPQFKDYKNGSYKVISFFAKRARGMMVRFAAQHRITDATELKRFDLDGYRFCHKSSSERDWVFTRRQ